MRGYSRSSLVIGSKQAEPGTWQGIRFLEASRNCSAIEARLRPLFVLHAEVRSAARRAGASVPPLPRIGPTCSPAQSPSGPAGDTWPHRRSGPCCCCPVRSPGQRRPAPPKSTARRLRGSMPTPSCAACDHLLLGVSRSFESRTARWISGSSPNSAVCDNQSATKSTQIALNGCAERWRANGPGTGGDADVRDLHSLPPIVGRRRTPSLLPSASQEALSSISEAPKRGELRPTGFSETAAFSCRGGLRGAAYVA